MKKTLLAIVTLMALVIFAPTFQDNHISYQTAEAKGSSGGFSSGGSRGGSSFSSGSSSRSSGGFSSGSRSSSSSSFKNTPPPGKSAAAATTDTQKNYSNNSVKSSGYDSAVNRQNSNTVFNEAKASNAPQAAKNFNSQVKNQYSEKTSGIKYTPERIKNTRQEYQTSRGYDYVPQYTYPSRPWGFSDFMLGLLVYDAFFGHHHSNNPDYKNWRADMDEKAKSDEKLKAKLTELDTRIAALEPMEKDPTYMPANVPAEVMFDEKKLVSDSEVSSFFTWVGYIAMFIAIGGVVTFFAFMAKNMFFNRARVNPFS